MSSNDDTDFDIKKYPLEYQAMQPLADAIEKPLAKEIAWLSQLGDFDSFGWDTVVPETLIEIMLEPDVNIDGLRSVAFAAFWSAP